MKTPALRFSLLAALLAASFGAHAARDVMLVLDNSGTMRRNDPQRLAIPAVLEFIAVQPPNTRIGIIQFDTAPKLLMPLTPAEVAADGEAKQALSGLNYRGPLTHIPAAIERAIYELRSEGRADVAHAIVLMTDGKVDVGDAARDVELHQWLRKDLAAQAAQAKIGIFGIAFTEQADYQLLQSLAATTGAEYFRVLTPEGISRALKGIDGVLAASPPTATPPPEAIAPPPPRPADATVGERMEPEAPGFPAWGALLTALVTAVAAVAAWALMNRRRGMAVEDTRRRGPIAVLFDSHERHEIGDRPVVIGRAGGNDPSRYYIVLPEKTIGRWHATIERRGQSFWVRDEGSVNGTFVNGERIQGERALKHRDTLRVHTHAFEFEIPELADADRTMLTSVERLHGT